MTNKVFVLQSPSRLRLSRKTHREIVDSVSRRSSPAFARAVAGFADIDARLSIDACFVDQAKSIQ